MSYVYGTWLETSEFLAYVDSRELEMSLNRCNSLSRRGVFRQTFDDLRRLLAVRIQIRAANPSGFLSGM